MHKFKRSLASKLKQRLDEFPRFIQIVGGPRQSGKTVLVRQVCEEIYDGNAMAVHFCAVDNPDISSKFTANTIVGKEVMLAPDKPDVKWLTYQWEKARALANSEKFLEQGCVLVLDEVQKISQWSDAVKGLWDEDRANETNLHVVLLGSSPLLMQQGLSESLLGRYELLTNMHWSFTEMSDAFDFNLEEYIYFGGYPGSASLIRDESRWLDYIRRGLIEPNIYKDILMMTRVDKPALLKSVFELSCEYSGQIYSFTKMLGQLVDKGNTTTLSHYLDLLTMAGLITGLQAYSGNKRLRRASKPKLNVLNTALMSCYSGYSFDQAKADRTFWGRLVESTVGAHLINTKDQSCHVRYWREKGVEVDYVLHNGNNLLAIEVKSNKHKGTIKGLEKFIDKYKNARTLLVGANGVSLQEFLSFPATYWLVDG